MMDNESAEQQPSQDEQMIASGRLAVERQTSSPYDSATNGDVSATSDGTTKPQPKFVARALFAGLLGTGLISATQIYGQYVDYQFGLYGTVAVGCSTLALVLWFLHRASIQAGHSWRVPVLAFIAALAFVASVRVKTLSGELVPQFEWRFASRELPELQNPSIPTNTNPTAPEETTTDGTNESSEAPESGPQLVATWGQFLGNERTGIAPEREFKIPQSTDEIETLWDIGIGGGWSSFAIAKLPDGTGIAITLEQRDEQECVTAYDLMTGELKWLVGHKASHYQVLGGGGPRSTPAIDGDKVYAQGATGALWCLNVLTGAEHWRADLLEIAGWDQPSSENAIKWGRSGSPLLVDGLCVTPFGADKTTSKRSLIAFDSETGEVRWKAGKDQISYASPQLFTIDGVRQIVSVNEATISGHSIEDGATLWQTDWDGQTDSGANCAAAVPAGENRLLVGKGYGYGSALIEIKKVDEQWVAEDVWRTNRVLKTKFNHSLVADGVAYGLSNGALQAVEVDSGERLWEQGRRGRYGQGQAIMAGDTLIVQAEMGEVALVEVNPSEFNELIRFDALNQKTWNTPSLSGNILLVRNGEEAIAFRFPMR